MKVFYRKAYGCFIFTDRYIRPWWWQWRHYLPQRFNSASFLIPCLLAFALAFVLFTLF